MKAKLLSILLLLAIAFQTPVYADGVDPEEPVSVVESTVDVKTIVFRDYVCLMSMYAHPPKIELLTEKTKEAYYCAKSRDYEKAVALFDSYIAEFTQIVEFHNTDYAEYSKRLSEQAALMGEVYNFYCRVAMKYCSMALSCLSYYINCSQSPEEEGRPETHENKYLEHIETAQYAMSLVNYVARYVTLAFTKGMVNTSDDPEMIYDIISETFTTPSNEKAYDWYNESYLVLKENPEETEFDISDIPAAVYYQNDCAEAEESTDIVYWVTKGEVYHRKRSCRALKHSDEIYSGPLDRSNKPHKCKICG